jgi:prepilin-type N-terminal cleavage/methylation domain-containing protein
VLQRSTGRLAFTMLELLAVIAIMTILSAMILVGAKAILGNAEKKKTETIIQTVKTGIELAIANKGSAISPTEHPLAGSNADANGPRFSFIRAQQGVSGTVATTGTALKGVPTPDNLSADANKLLMASDRYNDRRVVLLYGGRREDIGVLQSLRKVVTKYRLLPMPPRPANWRSGDPAPKVISPKTGNPATSGYQGDSNTQCPEFPDTLIPSYDQIFNQPFYGRMADSKPALDYLFGNSSAQAELSSLKAIYNADPSLPEDVNDFRTPIEERSYGGVREALVYTNAGTGRGQEHTKVEGKWKPGYIPVSGTTKMSLDVPTGSKWVRYRLAGLAVYDAWGNELLTTTGANNSYRVISAGQDGALAIDPSKDNSIDTDIEIDTNGKLKINEKDKDGAKDNLQ